MERKMEFLEAKVEMRAGAEYEEDDEESYEEDPAVTLPESSTTA